MAQRPVRVGTAPVEGAEFYYELRGEGPPVVLIPGGGGDADSFGLLPDLIAAEYTVLTYDRRGCSRSTAPPGWSSTTMPEQADDCVGLIEGLGLDHPVVIGHSNGGAILVALLEDHADLLAGAIVVEPALAAVAPSYPWFADRAMEIMSDSLSAGDAAQAMDALSRWMLGDRAWEAFAPDWRSRTDANQELNTMIDSPAVMAYTPNATVLAALDTPVRACAGEETTEACTWFVEGARWVAETTAGPLHLMPGGHCGFIEFPDAYAEALGSVLSTGHA